MLIQSILTIGSVVHGHVVTVYGIGRWAEYITVARRDKNPVIGYDVNTNFIFSFWFFFFVTTKHLIFFIFLIFRHNETCVTEQTFVSPSCFFVFPWLENMCHGTKFCFCFCFSITTKHTSRWNKVPFFSFSFTPGKKTPNFDCKREKKGNWLVFCLHT